MKKPKPLIYQKTPFKGKLCSTPYITNADLYFAFYRIGGYTPIQIARMFGKSYYVVYESLQRTLDPLNKRL